MNTSRWTAIVLLFFLAVSAIAGALPMIANPHGNPLGIPQTLLRTTPFNSFLGPGILLLIFNGMLAAWCLFMVWGRRTGNGGWTIFQGVVLLLWLSIECLMLRSVEWAHFIYGAVGAGLVLAGSVITASQPSKRRTLDY